MSLSDVIAGFHLLELRRVVTIVTIVATPIAALAQGNRRAADGRAPV